MFLNISVSELCSWKQSVPEGYWISDNICVPEFSLHQQHFYVTEYQCDMLLNLKVILNFPIHQHNFHVPECLCDEDAPANKNYLNATDYSRISVFLNWMYFVPEYKAVLECS